MKLRNAIGFFVGAPLAFKRSRDPLLAPTDTDRLLWTGAGMFLLIYNGLKLLR